MARRSWWAALLGVAALTASRALADENPPDDFTTRAEASDYEATADYDETWDYLRRLSAASPRIDLRSFGRSAAGRNLPLVVAAADGGVTPGEAGASGKAVVMIQNGIHAGEIDGKDASLTILRDIALGRHTDLLESVILLVVPIYNVDGHERISPFNRPNQNGPREGMGFRTTTDGHDLNRDHLKLVTPEARAMIGLFNTWRPHLHIDNHVTDGVDHDWVLTYSWAEAPQLAAPLDTWMRGAMQGAIESTRRAGHRIGPYVSLIDRGDPRQGFDSWVGEPRYATGYYPLRHCPSILVENHSYKPYAERVRANRDFLLGVLNEVARRPDELIDAVTASEKRTVALGRLDAGASDVVLGYRAGPAGESISFPVYDWFTEPSLVLGVPLLRYRTGKLRSIDVPWVHRAEPIASLPRPRGYLIEPGWPAIERRLVDHGIELHRLSQSIDVEVELIRISAPRRTDEPRISYQGLTRIEVDAQRTAVRRRVEAGTLFVPAAQVDFEVAVQLLEPEAPDSLVAWGLLSAIMERKEYIEPRILEELARAMLEDPATARQWREALEAEAFASDPGARYEWWYRRTEYWDERVGLMPVMRVLDRTELRTAPW